MIGYGLALLPLTVSAHHSFAPFDQTRLIDLSGVVVDFMLRSPHSILVIEAENNDGFAELWEVEMGPNPIMRRQGFDAVTFEPGDRIVVRGALRRDGAPGVLLGRGYFAADGAPIGRSDPLPVGGSEGSSGVDAADRFSGVWIVRRDPNINTFGDTPLPLTEWAAQHRENFDVRETPAMHCVPPNLPALFYPPYLYGVTLEDDRVVFHYEYFAIIRTVPLGRESARTESSGLFGYATARLDDGSIIVETDQFPAQAAGLASIFDPNGRGGDVPSSTRKRLTERYSLSDGGRTLVLEYTVEDPEYLTAPYSGRVILSRVPDDTPIQEFQCDEESASRSIQNVAPRD